MDKQAVRLLSLLSLFYGGIAVIFYFNGFNGGIGGSFVADLKALYPAEENVPPVNGVQNIPLAVGISLAFLWGLFYSVYFINGKTRTVLTGKHEEVTFREIAATGETVNETLQLDSDNLQMKLLLFLMGVVIFGGLLLTSFIDSSFYIKKYSVDHLWDFRIFTVSLGSFYFLLVYLYYRRKNKIVD
ncbi:hypothetical protein [Bacillus alkalicellulosilyticus]|uniref:hypothetical protein n=1 Tax=Alkalihalobacterium alkalicellulosilyticum TaxID=1912214 RepID=UPI000996DB8E|nr:hypothetical protein [Bacillus alkalicellulosilyticus]